MKSLRNPVPSEEVHLCGKKFALFFCFSFLAHSLVQSQSLPSIDVAPIVSSKELVTKLEEANSIVLSLKLNQDSKDTLMQQRELRLTQSESALKQKENDQNERELALSQTRSALEQREQILSGREASLNRTEAALVDLQSSLDSASKKLGEATRQNSRNSVKIAILRTLTLTVTGGLGGSLGASTLHTGVLPTTGAGMVVGCISGVVWGLTNSVHNSKTTSD
jgi:hypothetical protein